MARRKNFTAACDLLYGTLHRYASDDLIARGDRLIGIRPEQIRIVSQDGHPARVTSVEHLGADSIVLCEIEGSRCRCGRTVLARHCRR